MLAHLLNKIAVALALRSRLAFVVCRALGLLSLALLCGCAAPDLPLENHFERISAPFPALPVTASESNAKAGAVAPAPALPAVTTLRVSWNAWGTATGFELAPTPRGPWQTVTTLVCLAGTNRYTATTTTTNNPGFVRCFAR